jgi:pyruvate dehydrogenase E1 component
MANQLTDGIVEGIDPAELEEWYDSLEDVIRRYGPERVTQLLVNLRERAYIRGVMIPFSATTPYINTIHHSDQPTFPGDIEMERRIKSIVRWNALAMVHKANKNYVGVGGHISTFASSATLYEVGQNHFFHARTDDHTGDMVYFQGHASPGMYARAFVEGRLDESHLEHFRREIPRGVGLCSYPHPWLMPNFWQFPTVSMGLGPITAIYHARFLKYLEHRGLLDTSKSRVYCFMGDGEVDEPESLGALTLASRENLDNLTFIVNCNLQRLDGPVRGNGKIIQELEGAFRGAGWNCIKVIWGSHWDELLDKDDDGKLVKRMGEIVDGQYQKYSVEPGAYIRDHFFGPVPELAHMVEGMSDDELRRMKRGGHDPEKVYSAYKAATDHKGSPTVILAKTIKGYGLGEAGEGRNTTHNEKKIADQELFKFRSRFGIPIGDADLLKAPFYRFPEDSAEYKYMQERRQKLGGYLPARKPTTESLKVPALESFGRMLQGSGEKEYSTTGVMGQMISQLLKDENIGQRIVPIIPDEARTFGMEGLFKQCGIYSSKGQLYEPVDRETLMYYKEAKDGQLLEEGINEAGAISSFIAAGTSYANLGFPMIPIYVYYSMFGFQRVGDLVWLAADSRCKGFLVGGTSGRTTLNGEGLQHEDGHSHIMASTVPTLVAYDPAWGYELAVIVQNGLKRMYQDNEDVFFYLSVYNEDYVNPGMPEGLDTNDILKGMYRFKSMDVNDAKVSSRPQLMGSGPILNYAIEAQKILAEKYGIASDVWSVTSYNELARDCREVERWNSLHSDQPQKKSYLEEKLSGVKGPFISTSDNIRIVADQIRAWMPDDYVVLGTDGFGRSDTRPALRRHFEIDAQCVVYYTLLALSEKGEFDKARLPQVLQELGINPDKVDPAKA